VDQDLVNLLNKEYESWIDNWYVLPLVTFISKFWLLRFI